MPEDQRRSDWAERLDRFVEVLRRDRRPGSGLAQTPEELEDLRLAGRLAGMRAEHAEPDPAFLEQLRRQVGVDGERPRSRVTRARLLRVAGLWVAGVVGGLGIDEIWRRTHAPTSSGELVLARGQWYPVAQMVDLQTGIARPVEAGAVPAFVIREGETVRALSRVCTHQGCLLRFDAGEGELQCPCHGAVFNLNGQPDPGYVGYTLTPLPSLPTHVVKGTVYIRGA